MSMWCYRVGPEVLIAIPLSAQFNHVVIQFTTCRQIQIVVFLLSVHGPGRLYGARYLQGFSWPCSNLIAVFS